MCSDDRRQQGWLLDARFLSRRLRCAWFWWEEVSTFAATSDPTCWALYVAASSPWGEETMGYSKSNDAFHQIDLPKRRRCISEHWIERRKHGVRSKHTSTLEIETWICTYVKDLGKRLNLSLFLYALNGRLSPRDEKSSRLPMIIMIPPNLIDRKNRSFVFDRSSLLGLIRSDNVSVSSIWDINLAEWSRPSITNTECMWAQIQFILTYWKPSKCWRTILDASIGYKDQKN